MGRRISRAKSDRTNPQAAAVGWDVVWKALAIVALGFVVYAPALHGDWSDDDALYFQQNPLRHDAHRLWRTWFEPGAFIEYYPVTETVRMLQWQAWGNETTGYVLTNVLLHIANALLLWMLVRRLGVRHGWLAGVFFVVHPANVESVAWISELKNTLSQAPCLLALWVWVVYEERGRRRDYWLALGLYVLAMLCKISMAPLPVVLLLYAWWKHGRVQWRDAARTAPFFLVALTLGMTTQRAGETFAARFPHPAEVTPLGGVVSRMALAGTTALFYLGKFLLPWPLSPAYPQWAVPRWWQGLPWLGLAALASCCWRWRRTWGRHVALALGFFLLLLAPFLGLKGISYMTFTWVMDHFLYLPMAGMLALLMGGWDILMRRPGALRWGRPVAAAAVLVLALAARDYAGTFASQEALYRHALEINPGSRQAREILGWALMKKGKAGEASRQFEQCVRLEPGNANAHVDFATACMQLGRLEDARAHFETAGKLDARDANAFAGLGQTLVQMGRAAEGIAQLRKAVAMPGATPQACNDLGNALLQGGNAAEAIGAFEQAVALDPEVAQVRSNLGVALARAGRIGDARAAFREALRLDPAEPAAREALGQMP